MNRRFVAIALSCALTVTASLAGLIPGGFLGNDISEVSAKTVTEISSDGKFSISFDHRVNDPYFSPSATSSTIGIGESRAAIVEGTIIAATGDTMNKRIRIDSNLSPKREAISTYSFKKLTIADITSWTSSDPTVATVAGGVVTGLAKGYTTITATYSYQNEEGKVVTITASDEVRVSTTPVTEDLEDVYVNLHVGDSYVIPAMPTFRKGSQVDPESVKLGTVDCGKDTKWNDESTVCVGAAATFNTTNRTITATAAGSASVRINAKTVNGDSYYFRYYFRICDPIGQVYPEDYGTANYKILNAKEVAFAGMLHKTYKLVIPTGVYINNKFYEVVAIESGALKGTAITSVRIPNKVTKIGDNAFANCKGLKSVDISSTEVSSIGASAFSGCSKIKEFTINGNKLKSVGKKAFKGVRGKTTFYVESSSSGVYKKAVKKIKKAGAKSKFIEQD